VKGGDMKKWRVGIYKNRKRKGKERRLSEK